MTQNNNERLLIPIINILPLEKSQYLISQAILLKNKETLLFPLLNNKSFNSIKEITLYFMTDRVFQKIH